MSHGGELGHGHVHTNMRKRVGGAAQAILASSKHQQQMPANAP
jgi:hypothetical protein